MRQTLHCVWKTMVNILEPYLTFGTYNFAGKTNFKMVNKYLLRKVQYEYVAKEMD